MLLRIITWYKIEEWTMLKTKILEAWIDLDLESTFGTSNQQVYIKFILPHYLPLCKWNK